MKAFACLLVIVAFCTAEDALKTNDDIMLAFTKMQAQEKFEAKHALLMGQQEPAPAEVLLEEVPKPENSFAKVPSWVSTEDDLEAFLQEEQRKGTKIVRNTNGKVKAAPKKVHGFMRSKHHRFHQATTELLSRKRYRGRRSRRSVVRRWKKVKKTIKTCEVKVKGAKWNAIKGQCRGALRFCVLYRKFAKRFRMNSLLKVARPHCRKARKFHHKLWRASVVAARKARAARLRKCMKNKRCRRAYYRRLRRQARRRRYAAHRRCMKNKKCRAAWIRRRKWAAMRRLRRHKKCMKNKVCRKGFFAHRRRLRAARLARYRHRVARHKACMKNLKCKKRFIARRNARRASRRKAHIRCMKNKACKRRYRAWRKRRAARRAAWKKRRAARRKGRKGKKKGKKKSKKKGKKKSKKKGKKKSKKKSKKKGKKKGKFFNRHLKKMRKLLGRMPKKAPKKKKKTEETSLLQYTKFPSWVETEDDMEAYFKQQHTKVVRKDSGNGGVNPSGRKFVVDVQPKKSVEAEEAPISLLEDAATEGSKPQPAVKDRMQRLAKLNKRMATAGANKLIEELNNY